MTCNLQISAYNFKDKVYLIIPTFYQHLFDLSPFSSNVFRRVNTNYIFPYMIFFFSISTRLEAMSESRVELKCSLYNVHHEIDMDRLTVEWIASKYQPGNRMSSGLCDWFPIPSFGMRINNFLEKICAKKIVSYFSKFKNICIFLQIKVFFVKGCCTKTFPS